MRRDPPSGRFISSMKPQPKGYAIGINVKVDPIPRFIAPPQDATIVTWVAGLGRSCDVRSHRSCRGPHWPNVEKPKRRQYRKKGDRVLHTQSQQRIEVIAPPKLRCVKKHMSEIRERVPRELRAERHCLSHFVVQQAASSVFSIACRWSQMATPTLSLFPIEQNV